MRTLFRLFQRRGANIFSDRTMLWNGEQGKQSVSRRFSPRPKWQLFDEGISLVPEKQFTLDAKAAVGKLLG